MEVSVDDGDSHAPTKSHTQKLFVMRHGERLDVVDKKWRQSAVRKWDPPLTEKGTEQAMKAGEKLRSEGVQITRIFVSPFLRCVETAAGFIKGMFPDGTDISKLKVSIEYGLAELMNKQAIRSPRPPQSTEPWILSFDELFDYLPSGVVDTSVQPILPKLPDWEETKEDARSRYTTTFDAVANKFPNENILCISHGEGVAASVKREFSMYVSFRVPYCFYTQAEREVSSPTSETPPSTLPWKLLTELGPTSGLLYSDNKFRK